MSDKAAKRCGALVYPANVWDGPRKCSRLVIADGCCRTHHPDEVLRRARKAAERRAAQRAMSLRGYTTEELQAEIERRKEGEA